MQCTINIKRQLVISLMVEQKFWSLIPAYTKNRLMFWSNDKELSSEADAIDLNSLKKNIKQQSLIYVEKHITRY